MPKLAVRLEVEPGVTNPRKYVLWSNGVIDAHDGALPIPQSSMGDGYSAGTAPIVEDAWVEEHVVQALIITDWDTPSGWVLDKFGRIFNIGDAPEVPFANQPVAGTYPDQGYRDFVMDPSGATTQGYALNENGNVPNIGGSVVIGGQTDFIDAPAHRIVMPDWTSKKYVVTDWLGRRFSRHGAISLDASIQQPDGVQTFGPGDLLYNGYIGVATKLIDDLEIGGGHGWMLASFGWIHSLQDSDLISGNPVFEGLPIISDLAVIDDGTGATPLTLAVLSIYGGIHEFVVSTPPTRAVLKPDDPTTNTTRPKVIWSYGDLEADAQTAYVVRTFTDAVYGAGGFDPTADDAAYTEEFVGDGPLVRNVREVQLGETPNDTYRAYVWVRDSANLWAAGNVYKQWTQDVTIPVAPTVTITEGGPLVGHLINVDIAPADVEPGAVVMVEYRDGAAMPWLYVTGGEALQFDGAGHCQVRDREPPYNDVRTYRARQVIVDPHLAGAYSAEVEVTMDGQQESLVALDSTVGTLLDVRTFSDTRSVETLVVKPPARKNAIVVTDAVPAKGLEFDLELRTLDRATFNVLDQLASSGAVLLFRDAYGRTVYCKVTESFDRNMIESAPAEGEGTFLRHHHEWTIPVTQVSRPLVGPDSGPLALRDPTETVA